MVMWYGVLSALYAHFDEVFLKKFLDPRTSVKRLILIYWNWNFKDFCKKLMGLSPAGLSDDSFAKKSQVLWQFAEKH